MSVPAARRPFVWVRRRDLSSLRLTHPQTLAEGLLSGENRKAATGAPRCGAVTPHTKCSERDEVQGLEVLNAFSTCDGFFWA